ncbi:MAG TPA: pitrilysin family protein [Bacteroidota bacterium]|nr:pitrilysin family protein [Bacteroidota bacterium]
MITKLDNIPLLGNLSVERFQLGNGLSVGIVPDTTTPIFTYQTWFKVGSADEAPGRQGLAHLFEHMMFRETSTRAMGEFERIVNQNGGTGINAYTSRDQTVYFFTFPAEKLPLAADLEADRMVNLSINDAMFETEKGAVLTEKNRGLDDPNRLLWETVYDAAYTHHTYRYSTIGTVESIRGFSASEARSFYKSYYSPDNALVIIVGDVRAEEVVLHLEREYGGIAPSRTLRSARVPEPLQTEKRSRTITHPKATRRMIAKAWHIPSMTHSDFPLLAVVGRLLTSGKSAILNRRILNTAKATELFADVFISRDCGTFELFVQPSDGESFEEIEKIFLSSVTELAEGNVSEDQLLIVKNGLLRELYRAVTSPQQLARLIGDGFIYADDPAARIHALARQEQVTADDVGRVVREYILDANETTVYLLPEHSS